VRKWGSTPQGTASESGRRLDAIVLGSGWEVDSGSLSGIFSPTSSLTGTTRRDTAEERDPAEDPPWTVHQFHFHFLTSLLPQLLRIQAERNIRIVNLISPAWATALPSLKGVKAITLSKLQQSGVRGLTTLLLMQHFQLILDTLAASVYSKMKAEMVVPDPNATPEEAAAKAKKRDRAVKSNIMGTSVIMPWTRSEVLRCAVGADESWSRWLL
jgi:hypothetical protein